MRNNYIQTLFVIFPFVILLVVSSVFATWNYAGLKANEVSKEINFQINTFTYWEGAEILPNEEGESHVTLINNLLDGKDSNGNDVGLNNPESALSQNVQNRLNGGLWGLFTKTDFYGSMDGSILDNRVDMEGLFGTDTLGLDFIVQVIDDLTYYIFTTSVKLGESGAPNIPLGENIYPIYRSIAIRTTTQSDFVIQSTQIGYAPSVYYTQLSDSDWLHDQTVPSFDVSKWTAFADNPIGTSITNAVTTFVGDSNSATINTADDFFYFKIDEAGERIIKSENAYAIITVKREDGTIIATSQLINVDGAISSLVTFTASENTTYYIEFTGSTYIQFTVS